MQIPGLVQIYLDQNFYGWGLRIYIPENVQIIFMHFTFWEPLSWRKDKTFWIFPEKRQSYNEMQIFFRHFVEYGRLSGCYICKIFRDPFVRDVLGHPLQSAAFCLFCHIEGVTMAFWPLWVPEAAYSTAGNPAPAPVLSRPKGCLPLSSVTRTAKVSAAGKWHICRGKRGCVNLWQVPVGESPARPPESCSKAISPAV